MMMIKMFDCVQIKREGAEKIYGQIARMSSDEQLRFWMEKTELFRKRLFQRRDRIDEEAVSCAELAK